MPKPAIIRYPIKNPESEQILCGWHFCPNWATMFTYNGAGMSRINDKVSSIVALCEEHADKFDEMYGESFAKIG